MHVGIGTHLACTAYTHWTAWKCGQTCPCQLTPQAPPDVTDAATNVINIRWVVTRVLIARSAGPWRPRE